LHFVILPVRLVMSPARVAISTVRFVIPTALSFVIPTEGRNPLFLDSFAAADGYRHSSIEPIAKSHNNS
jgi:hypothetical protein